jgi:hypothetical protein
MPDPALVLTGDPTALTTAHARLRAAREEVRDAHICRSASKAG